MSGSGEVARHRRGLLAGASSVGVLVVVLVAFLMGQASVAPGPPAGPTDPGGTRDVAVEPGTSNGRTDALDGSASPVDADPSSSGTPAASGDLPTVGTSGGPDAPTLAPGSTPTPGPSLPPVTPGPSQPPASAGVSPTPGSTCESPIAPADGTYDLPITLGVPATLTDRISAPCGDTGDPVTVTLANPPADQAVHTTLGLTCTGTGTENVRFTVRPLEPTVPGCGVTVVRLGCVGCAVRIIVLISLPVGATGSVEWTLHVSAVLAPAPSPSATLAPTPVPTPTPSPTPSPTPCPTAPVEADVNLVVPLGGSANLGGEVSFPCGDTSDRVRYSVSGLAPSGAGSLGQLVIGTVCTGTGTQHVTFTSGTTTVGCGQTIVNRNVTATSNTGFITVTATGGSATLVQWALVAQAIKLN